MGADNQAEKIIDRIERMERLIAENEHLKGHKEEADRHIKTIAELRREKERLYDEVKRLNIRIRQDAEKAHQYLNEIDQLKEQLKDQFGVGGRTEMGG
jgi:phage host-nuclease inhibitor protein Gam